MDIDDMGLSPEPREKARACKTPEELLALVKEEGFELSDEQLQDVSGGANWNCWPFCPGQCHDCKTLNYWLSILARPQNTMLKRALEQISRFSTTMCEVKGV